MMNVLDFADRKQYLPTLVREKARASNALVDAAGHALETRNDRRFAAATVRCEDREVRLIDNVPV